MKTCEKMLFGISIDEHVLLKASLALLCFLSLLLIVISILIVWLKKLQRRVASLTKNACPLSLVISNKRKATFRKRNSWKNLVGVNAYGPLGLDGDGSPSDLPQETSFDNSLAPENDDKSVHGSNTADDVLDSPAAHHSTTNHPHQKTKGDYKLEKDYMSLKNFKGAKEHTYARPCANSPRVKSKMGCAERQNGKALDEQRNDDSHEDDHGYLVVIHSDKSSALSEGTEKETPSKEEESLYLIPIESKLEENGLPKMESKNETDSEGNSKANVVSKNDDRASPLDVPEEGKYGYLASQHVIKLATFGHNNVDFQQTQPGASKDADEDDSGYLILHHVKDRAHGKAGTNIPVGQFQAGDLSESDGPVNKSHRDDNSYEYIQTIDRTRPADNNDSQLQTNNPTGKGKPVTNSSAEDNHDYLTPVGHETEVTIHDNNNNTNAGAQSEVIYVNQNCVQNLGVEYPDDVTVYANNDAQQQSYMSNDNAAFCTVDENPLYDNPMI